MFKNGVAAINIDDYLLNVRIEQVGMKEGEEGLITMYTGKKNLRNMINVLVRLCTFFAGSVFKDFDA